MPNRATSRARWIPVFVLILTILFFPSSFAAPLYIINGTPLDPEETGFVYVVVPGESGVCSGTLLTNEWVLTARHCVNDADIANPSRIRLQMGSQQTSGAHVITNVKAAGTLIRLREPFRMNDSTAGYVQDIYKGTDSALLGESLSCYGYGYNTPQGGGIGILRYANLVVGPDRGRCTTDCYVLEINGNGQILAGGDSGGSCVRNIPGRPLTGITWGSTLTYSEQISSAVFREYALYHVHKEEFGGTLSVGDFNGDGYEDLVVVVPNAFVISRPFAGAARVYSGSPNGFRFRQTLTQAGFLSVETGDQFGYALASGDFDGDGKDDLAVGAPGEAVGTLSSSGYVVIYRGSSEGLQVWHGLDQAGLGGNAVDDRFGYALASGDFNGDGRDDLAVGAPGKRGSGYVAVFSGSPAGLNATTGIDQGSFFRNEGGDRFGYSLVTGDFDDDGWDDLVVGAPGKAADGVNASGAAYYFRATYSGLKRFQQILPQDGGLATAEDTRLFGWALSVGDFDGSGDADLAVGAPQEMGGRRAGKVFLYDFVDPLLHPRHALTQGGVGSNEFGDWFGAALAAGDLDGDGKDDLVVGTPAESPGEYPESGAVFIFRGQSGSIMLGSGFSIDQRAWSSNEKGDWFGGAVAIMNDPGTPGTPAKLLVGTPGETDTPNSSPGAVHVMDIYPTQNRSQTLTSVVFNFFPHIVR